MFPSGPFLLLLQEVGGGGRGRGRPHAPDDPDAVLREGGQAQLLALVHLDVLELLKASQGELPKQRSGLRVRGRNRVREVCIESKRRWRRLDYNQNIKKNRPIRL